MLTIFSAISDFLNGILFYEVFGFPLLVLWLIMAGLFLSFKLCFPNVRFFKHGLDVALHNKYYSPNDIGDLTPRQALFTSISGTVGLGNISGVAIAVALGGPGAVIWMLIMAFFSMNVVFSEATLSQSYRITDQNGKIVGGPFRYLRYGLKDIGKEKIGIVLSVLFSFFLIFGVVGLSMFQTNQAIAIITNYKIFNNMNYVFGVLFAGITLYTLINGAKTIGKIIEKLIPAMAILYFFCAVVILAVNYKNILPSFIIMLKDAFGFQPIVSGLIGTMVMGIRRAGFSNEAGLGTTSIAHSLAKTKEPIREASIACLTPMIDTMFFCFLTGLMIVASGAYNTNAEGVLMTKQAFLSVNAWFPIFLSIAIIMFALSNTLSCSFYGQTAWKNLTKGKFIFIFNILVVIGIISAAKADLDTIVSITDTFYLSLAIPNLIGVFMLSGLVKKKLIDYREKLKSGVFDK